MPTYQYSCTECGEQVEAVQKFTDEPLQICDVCGGKLRKVFSAVGIVFKGSGFYRNDSRSASKDKVANGSASSDTKKDSGSADSGSPDSKKTGKTSTDSSKSSSSSSGDSSSSAPAGSSSSKTGSGSKVA